MVGYCNIASRSLPLSSFSSSVSIHVLYTPGGTSEYSVPITRHCPCRYYRSRLHCYVYHADKPGDPSRFIPSKECICDSQRLSTPVLPNQCGLAQTILYLCSIPEQPCPLHYWRRRHFRCGSYEASGRDGVDDGDCQFICIW